MKLVAIFRKDRTQPGSLHILEGEHIVFGPALARGEADNAAAAGADNVDEDPERPYGDHPAGHYHVTEVVDVKGRARDTYGPFFLRLDPVGGEALRAKEAGRTGIGIHGGRPGQRGTDNQLRATYGCLRLANGHVAVLASLVQAQLASHHQVVYDALLIDEDA